MSSVCEPNELLCCVSIFQTFSGLTMISRPHYLAHKTLIDLFPSSHDTKTCRNSSIQLPPLLFFSVCCLFCTMISVVILFSSSVVYFLRPPCPGQIEWLIKKTKISRTEKKRRVRKVVKLPTTVSEWGVQHTDDEPFTVNVGCSLHYPRPSMEIETVKWVKRLTASNGIFVTFAVIDDFYHNYGSRQWDDRFRKRSEEKTWTTEVRGKATRDLISFGIGTSPIGENWFESEWVAGGLMWVVWECCERNFNKFHLVDVR